MLLLVLKKWIFLAISVVAAAKWWKTKVKLTTLKNALSSYRKYL
jgi:hypothetical protein